MECPQDIKASTNRLIAGKNLGRKRTPRYGSAPPGYVDRQSALIATRIVANERIRVRS